MSKCCILGHRKVELTNEQIEKLKSLLESLIIEHQVDEFLFGTNSDFIYLCHDLVTKLKNKYPHINRTCYTCKHEAVFMEEKKAYWEEIYSNQKKTKVEINCFDKEHSHKTKLTAGKASYVERNQALIKDCDICLFYYLANYSPPKRKHPYLYNIKIASKSGTALAFKYAIQKHKKIINFADF